MNMLFRISFSQDSTCRHIFFLYTDKPTISIVINSEQINLHPLCNNAFKSSVQQETKENLMRCSRVTRHFVKCVCVRVHVCVCVWSVLLSNPCQLKRLYRVECESEAMVEWYRTIPNLRILFQNNGQINSEQSKLSHRIWSLPTQ